MWRRTKDILMRFSRLSSREIVPDRKSPVFFFTMTAANNAGSAALKQLSAKLDA
jgi:hypothetical protein